MTATDDRLEEALAAIDMQPVLWKPEPGDQVAGEVVGFGESQAPYGMKRTVVVAEAGSERRVSIRLDYSVLEQEVAQRDPQVGDAIVVRRNRDKQGARGWYRHYDVAVVPGDVSGQ